MSPLALSAPRSDLVSAAVGYPVALRAVEAAFPDASGEFVSVRRVRPFSAGPGRCVPRAPVAPPSGGGAGAAFLYAVADATCARSQCSFPLHVLPPTLGMRRLLDPLCSGPPAASRVTSNALTGLCQ